MKREDRPKEKKRLASTKPGIFLILKGFGLCGFPVKYTRSSTGFVPAFRHDNNLPKSFSVQRRRYLVYAL